MDGFYWRFVQASATGGFVGTYEIHATALGCAAVAGPARSAAGWP
ncbi:hypothetical protein [Streptomyces djakartensis]